MKTARKISHDELDKAIVDGLADRMPFIVVAVVSIVVAIIIGVLR